MIAPLFYPCSHANRTGHRGNRDGNRAAGQHVPHHERPPADDASRRSWGSAAAACLATLAIAAPLGASAGHLGGSRVEDEAAQYIGDCKDKNEPLATCEGQIRSFKRAYVAAWQGDHSSVEQVASVLANEVHLTVFTSPYVFNFLQGCAWAIVANDPGFAGTSENDMFLKNSACLGLSSEGAMSVAEARATVILAGVRNGGTLPPAVPNPPAGSAAARAADAMARKEAATYVAGCPKTADPDADRNCNYNVQRFIFDYRRALGGDLLGQENVSTLLNGEGLSGGITTNHLQACAWAIFAADPRSPLPSEVDAGNVKNRCGDLPDEMRPTAISRADALFARLYSTPNAIIPDSDEPQ